MYNCPVCWYTVVDEMSVDEMSVNEMSVDEKSVDELSWNPPRYYSRSLQYIHHWFMLFAVIVITSVLVRE